MRKVSDIKEAMVMGSEWEVSSPSSSGLFRVVKRQTNAFFLMGPLDHPKDDWRLVRHNWPNVIDVAEWGDDHFTLKEGHSKVRYERR